MAGLLLFAAADNLRAQQMSETVVHNFSTPPKGANPNAGVIRDGAANLYGTTANGGIWGEGVVYKVTPTGKETVLYNFTGGHDGSNPYAGVIADSAGNLYGTTQNGGAFGIGVVYMLNPAGQETVLYSFTNGGWPYAGVIRDSAGNFYGTDQVGGSLAVTARNQLNRAARASKRSYPHC